MLPTFVVIGAAKAGTTSLHLYLGSHPEIFLPPEKELDFFIESRNWKRGISWYERHFEEAAVATAIGEVSPGYAFHPHFEGVPERIARVLPEARLIYLVRHPIERMISHYQHRVIGKRESDPPEKALLENPFYLDGSRYAHQIEQYLPYFERDRLLVVGSEELRANRHATLRRVCRFLDVAEDWWSPKLEHEANVTRGKRIYRPGLKRIARLPGIRTTARALPAPIQTRIRRATHRDAPTQRISLPDAVEARLEELLREDVRSLRSLVGGQFDGWGIA